MCHHNCGCEQHAHMDRGLYHHGGYSYSHHRHSIRHFPTREEIIQEMEDYLKQLRAEVRGVEEHLAEMKKES